MRHAVHDMPRGMASGQVLASLAHPTIRTCPGEALAKDWLTKLHNHQEADLPLLVLR